MSFNYCIAVTKIKYKSLLRIAKSSEVKYPFFLFCSANYHSSGEICLVITKIIQNKNHIQSCPIKRFSDHKMRLSFPPALQSIWSSPSLALSWSEQYDLSLLSLRRFIEATCIVIVQQTCPWPPFMSSLD